MLQICPKCAGSGVDIIFPSGLSVPKTIAPEEIMKMAKKTICPFCKGTGEVETGWLARQLGLKRQAINEKTDSENQTEKDEKIVKIDPSDGV